MNSLGAMPCAVRCGSTNPRRVDRVVLAYEDRAAAEGLGGSEAGARVLAGKHREDPRRGALELSGHALARLGVELREVEAIGGGELCERGTKGPDLREGLERRRPRDGGGRHRGREPRRDREAGDALAELFVAGGEKHRAGKRVPGDHGGKVANAEQIEPAHDRVHRPAQGGARGGALLGDVARLSAAEEIRDEDDRLRVVATDRHGRVVPVAPRGKDTMEDDDEIARTRERTVAGDGAQAPFVRVHGPRELLVPGALAEGDPGVVREEARRFARSPSR